MMSYEYKEEILSDIGPEPNCNYESESNRYYDKIDELDHVYAQATKADEYEAKAKSYTELVSQISAVDEIVATNYDKDMTDTNLHLLMLGAEVKRFFESGGSDD